MKNPFIAIFTLLISGCAGTAIPNFYNGNYYMAGDPSCVQMRSISSARIMCVDKTGAETGYRDAMTYEQLLMYRTYSEQEKAQMQALNESMRQVGQTFQNAGQQINQQSQQYNPSLVQPIAPQGRTTYRRTGNAWVGSDGSSCQVVGQSILCSDGRRCQMVGQNLICN